MRPGPYLAWLCWAWTTAALWRTPRLHLKKQRKTRTRGKSPLGSHDMFRSITQRGHHGDARGWFTWMNVSRR